MAIIVKACPFCGGKATVAIGQDESDPSRISYSVICQNCGVGIFRGKTKDNLSREPFDSAEDAAEAWNKRKAMRKKGGVWMWYKKSDGEEGVECSKCETRFSVNMIEMPYCPACGAEMEVI